MQKLLRGKRVDEWCGFSCSTRERLVKAGQFPQPVKTTAGTRAWVEEEVDAWIAARIAARDSRTEADPVLAATSGRGQRYHAINGTAPAPSPSPAPAPRQKGDRTAPTSAA